MNRARSCLLAATVLVALAGATAAPVSAAPISSDLVISQAYGGGGNSGAPLANDYVELYNRGALALSLGGRSIQYASATGTGNLGASAAQLTVLPDVTLQPGQYFLVQEGAGSGGGAALPSPDATGSIAMSATGGKVALADRATSLGCNGSSTPCSAAQQADIRDLVGYGSANFFEGSAAAPAASNTLAVLRGDGGCVDTGDNRDDFTAASPAPRTTAIVSRCSGAVPERCGDAITTIPAIQGNGALSPRVGERVSTEGVVVGDFQGSTGDGSLGGFFVQDPDGDGDTQTSDGIFVFDPDDTPDVREGDVVRVTGSVAEFKRSGSATETLTELTGVTVAPCGERASLPAASVLDLPQARSALERLEGMRVRTSDRLTVTDLFNLRFGEALLSANGPLVQPTERLDPGAAAVAADQANTDRTILLDDGRSSTNLDPIAYTSEADALRRGDQIAGDIEGALSFDFNQFRIQPTSRPEIVERNPRPPVPEDVGGDVSAGSFNVLNYFITFGRGEDRGADDAAGLARQQAKIVKAINAQDASVLGLQEIQDTADEPAFGNDPDAALDRLVAALNADAGNEKWAKSPVPQPFGNTDEIRVAQIYQPAKVSRVGAPVAFPDPAFVGLARVPIAQTYRFGRERFTVIANHFKSKGCRGATGADTDQGDGQGCFNAARVRQANALLRFADALKGETGDEDVLIVGDLNAYSAEDPVRELVRGGFENLNERFEGPTVDDGSASDSYSYVFFGRQGVLDHALASRSMAAKATGSDLWHINADEARVEEYDGFDELYTADPYRSSDHDASKIGFALGGGRGEKVKPPRPKTVDVQLLALNDFHGNLAPPTGSGGRITPPGGAPVAAGGVEYLATHIKRLEAQNPNTVVVSAGDLIGASPLLSALFHDEPTVEAMNSLGLDLNAVGNHEFDEGADELLRMQKGGCHPVDGCQDGDGFAGADFGFLAANVFAPAKGKGARRKTIFPPYEIKRFRGEKVAFIGMTLQGTPSIVSPSGIEGYDFRDEADTVNALVPELKRRGAEAIVVLVHEGGFPSGSFNECPEISGPIVDIVNRTSDEVDLFVTGHTHQAYNCVIDGRPVTSASSFGRLVTDIDMKIDRRTGEPTEIRANNEIITRDVPKDAAQTALIDKYSTLSAPIANRVIGSITTDITRDNTPAGESALGDVIADAQLAATEPTGDAVAAFMNPGGIRADLSFAQSAGEGDGNVTYAEAFTVQPFSNSLVTMTLTGAQIEQLLERQWEGQPFPRVLQVSSGFTYRWDPSAPVGDRVDPASIEIGGVAIDPAAGYRITVNSFLADGGDNFSVLREGTDRLGGDIDLDALEQYFQANSPVAPGARDRITQVP